MRGTTLKLYIWTETRPPTLCVFTLAGSLAEAERNAEVFLEEHYRGYVNLDTLKKSAELVILPATSGSTGGSIYI